MGSLLTPSWTDRTDSNQRFYMVVSFLTFNIQFSQIINCKHIYNKRGESIANHVVIVEVARIYLHVLDRYRIE